ncbi:MAG TPA: hypothetical protein VM870_04580 [Pyrinomonadaceae bacterium]|nr:hypothetical protein [Pyrinomonadaceae bacterium]
MKKQAKKKQAGVAFFLLNLAASLVLVSSSAAAQPNGETTKALTMLPASDVVMYVEVKRLLTEMMPRVLAGNPARQAQTAAEIEKFRATTGVDPRQFDRIAVSTKVLNPTPEVTKAQTAVIAQGTFSAPAIVAAGRLAAKGKYQEQKYGDKTIYLFSLNEQVRLLGLFRMNVSDLALAVLDPNTLALGSLDSVRECIDVNKNGAVQNHANDALLALATGTPNAVIGFGGNLPASVARNLQIGNEEIARNVAAIRQFYGSVGTTANGFDLLTVLRAEDANGAQGLSDTLGALKQFAPLLAVSLPAPRGKIAQTLVDNLQITKQGADVQLKLSVAPADFPALMGE